MICNSDGDTVCMYAVYAVCIKHCLHVVLRIICGNFKFL